jgi:hypothetical protein
MSSRECLGLTDRISRRSYFARVQITADPNIVVKFLDCPIVLSAYLVHEEGPITIDLGQPTYLEFLRGLAEDGPGYEHECNGIMFEFLEKYC